jgi:hypothetical protein
MHFSRSQVSADRTEFFEGVDNLFNPDDPDNTTTGYYNRENTLVADNYLRTSGYIPVIPGDKITSSIFGNAHFVLWFTSKETGGFKSYTNYTATDSYATVPDGAYYAKFSYDRRNITSYQINKGTELQTYSKYNPRIKKGYLKSLYQMESEYNEIVKHTVNLFNPLDPDVVRGGYYSRTNEYTVSSSLGMTGYIEVIQNFDYSFSPHVGGYVLWFDENKNLLGYTDYLAETVYVTAIANAKYAKFLFALTDESAFIVNSGKTVADYEPYTRTVVRSEYLPETTSVNYWENELGVAFGTSLTYRALTTGGYLQYLPQLSKAIIENKGVGNSTIFNNGSNPNMLSVIKNYTGYSGKRFALLEGFVNDWYNNSSVLGTWKDDDEDTVCGCVRSAINYMLSQNPSLTIILILDHYGRNYGGVNCSSTAERDGTTQIEFYDEISKVAASLGVPVIPLYKMSGMCENTPYYYIDNIHPSESGAQQTANSIWAKMKNITPKVVDPEVEGATE